MIYKPNNLYINEIYMNYLQSKKHFFITYRVLKNILIKQESKTKSIIVSSMSIVMHIDINYVG